MFFEIFWQSLEIEDNSIRSLDDPCFWRNYCFQRCRHWGELTKSGHLEPRKRICYRIIYARDVLYIYCEVIFCCNEKDLTNKGHYFRAFRRPGCPYVCNCHVVAVKQEPFFMKLFSPNITSQINWEQFFPLNGVLGELVGPFLGHPFTVKINSETDLA